MTSQKSSGGEILIDESVRKSLIHGKTQEEIGLIIGAYGESPEDLRILHLACSKSDEEESDKTLSSGGAPRLSTISVGLLSHHVKQLLRMLPGGLQIVGIYVVEGEEDIFNSKHEDKIKILLGALGKQLGRNSFYNGEPLKHKVFFHFGLRNKKFNLRVFDGAVVAKQHFQTVFAHTVWESLAVDFDTSGVVVQSLLEPEGADQDQNQEDQDGSVKHGLMAVLRQWQETLQSSMFLVNGKSGDSEKVFVGEGCEVAILIKQIPAVLLKQKKDFVNHLHLQGKIHSVAFIPKGASTLAAVKALETDIMRSMSARLEMHCESLIDEDSNSSNDSKVYHEIPRRVFVDLLPNKVKVSDYLFPGEGARDSIRSFGEILDMKDLEEDMVDLNKELPFDLEELHQNRGSMEELLSKAESISKISPIVMGSNKKAFAFVICLTAFAFAFLAYVWPLLVKKVAAA